MLTIELLNAGHGDAILITYGDDDATHRVIVDGGPYYSYDDPGGLFDRLSELPEDERHIELLVMTHIDTDHIDGVIRLLQEQALGLTFGDIWFNGWKHVQLAVDGELGGIQGEILGALLDDLGLPWNVNEAWEATKGAVVVPDDGALPVAEIAGGAKLTLLSPRPEELRKLEDKWDEAVRAADFVPGDADAALAELADRSRLRPLMGEGELGTTVDTSEANASSIAFVFEYDGHQLLLTGDAFASVLEDTVERYRSEHGSLEVEAFKLPHHGSWSNLSPELLAAVETSTYLVSSNGSYYNHPDVDAIELILIHGGKPPHFVFNYESDETKPWLDPDTQTDRGYTAIRANAVVIAT